MRVLLVHGLGRTPLSMLGLARDLRRAGHQPKLVGYVAALEPFAAIVARVRRHLVAAAEAGAPYAAVGHSLGGLVLRAALAGWPSSLAPPRRIIMLGTPNQLPRLAVRLHRYWPYALVTGQAGRVLADAAFFARLPVPAVPCTIIAGTRGWRHRRFPFAGEPNDGLVAVTETRLGAVPSVELPVAHTFMMNNRRVRTLVRQLLAEAAA